MTRQTTFIATALLLAAGCNQGPNENPFDPDAEAQLPGWVDSELQGQEDACNTSDLWNDGQTNIATTFFVGSYALENDDSFASNEFWLLWPDNDLAATGFEPCQVVWDVSGQRVAGNAGFDYALEIFANVDENETTCAPNADGITVYEGEETFNITYDVTEIGNDIRVFFPSGDELGGGEATNNAISWLSAKNCIIL